MHLSTKGRYAARAALELAMVWDKGPLKLQSIAENQNISERYLERLMTLLVASGIVKSIRGKKGGFKLNADPSTISLLDVVQSAEGSLFLVSCQDDPGYCHRNKTCITFDIWNQVSQATMDILKNISLSDMVRMHQQKNSESSMMFYI